MKKKKNHTRKQIAFDLDTKALEKYYPSQNWRKAYEDIKKEMLKYNFEWKQGSVYNSIDGKSSVAVLRIIRSIVKTLSWLNACMRDCVITTIRREHSLNHLFNKKEE